MLQVYSTGRVKALATPQEIEQWLQEGIAAAKAGQVETARFKLLDVVEQQQTNEAAWYWLYHVFDRLDDKRTCLENLIIINPQNRWAKQELLNHLDAAASGQSSPAKESPRVAKQAAKRPVTLKLVSAFWFGISIIFLSSGIISAIEWLTSGPANQNLPVSYIYLNLLMMVLFIIVGVAGLYVAITLLLRSMVGFYGSLLLSLGLLLVGPTASLIVSPPSYVTMICTGGISGMIVLLTLASQSGFENGSSNGNTSN